MLFTNILPEAICCLETLNVYVVLLMLFCIIICEQTFMATTNNRYILTGTFSYCLRLFVIIYKHILCVGDIAMHIHNQLSWSLVLTLFNLFIN